MLVALAGARLAGSGATGWWFSLRIPPGAGANRAAFYLGLVAIAVAWLGIGRRLGSARSADLRALRGVAVAWSLPLLAGPVLFSHDIYSYLAQGEILHLGLNPYHNAPVVLGHLGQPHLLAAVSPFWQRTTAPYGPLFVKLASLIVAITGSHLVAGVLCLRALDIAGVALLAGCIPRLARALGADPIRATWLTVLSPLVLLELLAAGHNDALLVGLTAAGVTLAVTGRPLPAIALCALAATIKLPAAVAVVFITASWAWPRRDKLRIVLHSVLAVVAVGLVVSLAAGTGLSWLSPSLLSTPQRVQLAITPATGVGWTVAAGLRDLGVAAGSRHLESAMGTVALALLIVVAAWLLWRTRPETMVRNLGVTLLAAALCGPAAWPWYLTWGLALLAAVPTSQRSWALPLVTVASIFVVKPDGILALPLQSAPAVVACYVVIAALVGRYAWTRRHRHRDRVPPAVHECLGEAPVSALAESR